MTDRSISVETGASSDPACGLDAALAALADGRRRTVLSRLLASRGRTDVRDLATRVAAAEDGVALLSVTEDRHDDVALSLHHVHLPMLRDAGLVDVTDGAAIATDRAERLDGVAAACDDLESPDSVLGALADRRRRSALRHAAAVDGALPLSALAECIAVEADADREGIVLELHHRHLPVLDDAGLLAYDPAERSVEDVADRALDDGGILDAVDGVLTASTPRAVEDSDVLTVEGRDAVISHGQHLLDTVEDELFVMITTDGLLEPRCLDLLRDALDRGVDVYIGSQSSAVRDLVRREVPDAVLWEPQLNWLNLPPNRETLGRLVFADRESIMLGTLGDDSEAGVARETALVGEGEDNPLVILMRELLGPRLDHLDGQSEDVLSRVPL